MKKGLKITLIISLVLVSISGALLYYNYYFVFSEGTRVGVLIKFSKKGNVFKTYEGEIIQPGITSNSGANSNMRSNTFKFSVTNKVLADSLMGLQGQELELHYKQFKKNLPWRGDTYTDQEGQYIIDKLVRVKNHTPNAYGL